MPEMPAVGLVGLGRMGTAMCANLVRAGYRVQAGDRRSEAAGPAARCGAHWVPQLSRLAAESDVLITVLPGPDEVREAMTDRARDLEVPFQLSEAVAAIYGRAVRRYGAAEGELLSIALLEEKAGRRLRHEPERRSP